MLTSLDGYEQHRMFIDQLIKIGLDQYIDLPVIAVMGDTSSGKSAVLSSISGVELPSSHLLTTRCPIMLKMKRSNTVSATIQVNLRKESKTEAKFNPVVLNMSNWNTIQKSISQAQEFVLRETGKEVARDVVEVEVCGPSCEDLTLIDLPGIVRSTGKGESSTLSPDIQVLIDDYLQNPRCVILAVHPANVDFHNSSIMEDARKVDPETKRTIPVITKPDLIDRGAEDGVRDLLLGVKTEGFERGFHMVKGRGQAALDKSISIATALKEEEIFFENTTPWKDVDDRSLFGARELRKKLGALQMEMIKSSFSDIVKDLKLQRKEVQHLLDNIGSFPLSDVDRRLKFQTELERFVKSLNDEIIMGAQSNVGNTDEKNEEHSVAAKFFDLASRLKVKLSEGRLASIDRPRVGDAAVARIGVQEYKGNVTSIVGDMFYIEGGHTFSSNAICRDPEWLIERIKQHMPLFVPFFLSGTVFSGIVAEFVEDEWKLASVGLADSTATLLREVSERNALKTPGLETFPSLGNFFQTTAKEVAAEMVAETRSKIEAVLEVNKDPFSQDIVLHESLARFRTKGFETALTSAFGLDIAHSDHINYNRQNIRSVVSALFGQQQTKELIYYAAGDLQHALATYGAIALKRTADDVPLLCQKMLRDFSDRVKKAMIVTDEKLKSLLEVSPQSQQKYTDAKVKIKRLDMALGHLNGQS